MSTNNKYHLSTESKQELKSEKDLPNLSSTSRFYRIIASLPENEPIPPAIIYFGLLTRELSLNSDDYSINFDKVPTKQAPQAVVPPQALHAVRNVLLESTERLSQPQKDIIGDLIESTNLNRNPKEGCKPERARSVSVKQNPISISWLEKYTESSKTNSYDCPYCSKEYTDVSEFKSHKNKCDERDKSKNIGSDDKNINTQNYECKHCKKKFGKMKKRNKHEKNCSDSEKPGSSTGGSVGKSVKKDNRGERVAGKNPFADSDRLKDTGLHQGGG